MSNIIVYQNIGVKYRLEFGYWNVKMYIVLLIQMSGYYDVTYLAESLVVLNRISNYMKISTYRQYISIEKVA